MSNLYVASELEGTRVKEVEVTLEEEEIDISSVESRVPDGYKVAYILKNSAKARIVRYDASIEGLFRPIPLGPAPTIGVSSMQEKVALCCLVKYSPIIMAKSKTTIAMGYLSLSQLKKTGKKIIEQLCLQFPEGEKIEITILVARKDHSRFSEYTSELFRIIPPRQIIIEAPNYSEVDEDFVIIY